MKTVWVSFPVLLFVLVSVSTTAEYVEDFEYDSMTDLINSSGTFQHNITSPLSHPGCDLVDTGLAGIGKAFYLTGAYDYVTFSLDPGESVTWISFDFNDGSPGNTSVMIFGTESNYTYYPTTPGTWLNWDSRTASLPSGLGAITAIQLSSMQGGFDNITIGVVPEPASVMLLVMGGLAAFRRRSRSI